jgi:hypothetical protein
MATITDVQQVGASATVENIIAGSKYEFPEVAVVVTIWGVVDLTDYAAGARVLMDATAGNSINADGAVYFAHTDNLGPLKSEHLMTRFVARAGQRIQLRVRETSGNAADIRTIIEINEIA